MNVVVLVSANISFVLIFCDTSDDISMMPAPAAVRMLNDLLELNTQSATNLDPCSIIYQPDRQSIAFRKLQISYWFSIALAFKTKYFYWIKNWTLKALRIEMLEFLPNLIGIHKCFSPVGDWFDCKFLSAILALIRLNQAHLWLVSFTPRDSSLDCDWSMDDGSYLQDWWINPTFNTDIGML